MSQNDDNTQDRFEDEVNEIIKNVSDDMPEFKAKPSRTLQDLLDEVVLTTKKYLVMTDTQHDALALWVAGSHAHRSFDTFPRLSVQAPEKESGKSRVLEVISNFVPNPLMTADFSVSSMARSIDTDKTMLLDEVDAIFKSNSDENRDKKAIINAGFRANGTFLRNTGSGGMDITPKEFNVYSPVALAGIGGLPDTIESRSIIIHMKRKRDSDKVTRFFFKQAEKETKILRKDLELWAVNSSEDLTYARPEMPSEYISDRAEEMWEPIVAIGDMANEDWGKRARTCAVELSAQEEGEEDSTGTKLLRDIKSIFDDLDVPRIFSGELVNKLKEIETSDWNNWHRGNGLNQNDVAKILKGYGIKPSQIRIQADNKRGYEFQQFVDAFSRYLNKDFSLSSFPVSTWIKDPSETPDTEVLQDSGSNNTDVTDVMDVKPSVENKDNVYELDLDDDEDDWKE